jgi:hypothetical protein
VQQRDDVRVAQRRDEPHLALEARDVDRPPELRRQHLHDDAAPQSHLLGHEDAAHPAAAELALDRVRGAERLAQARGELVGELGGAVGTRSGTRESGSAERVPVGELEEARRVVGGGEQRHDVAAQRRVVSAGRVDEARALRPVAVERALEDAHGLRLSRRVEPRGGRRHAARSSCRSQARAAAHARLTVAVETSSASAVCSMVKPAT